MKAVLVPDPESNGPGLARQPPTRRGDDPLSGQLVDESRREVVLEIAEDLPLDGMDMARGVASRQEAQMAQRVLGTFLVRY